MLKGFSCALRSFYATTRDEKNAAKQAIITLADKVDLSDRDTTAEWLFIKRHKINEWLLNTVYILLGIGIITVVITSPPKGVSAWVILSGIALFACWIIYKLDQQDNHH